MNYKEKDYYINLSEEDKAKFTELFKRAEETKLQEEVLEYTTENVEQFDMDPISALEEALEDWDC